MGNSRITNEYITERVDEENQRAKKVIASFPEVTGVLSQTGRSNDGTDPNGFGFVQFAVALQPS